ncbi:hypothetical protein GCM10023315_27380 [Algibacter aquimarinus]|uniref:Uncharacterized protein n=2 Tax=Algibacter aquimarinus TaxID=1136748 RepID=A0ABP9HPK4_9FLAO
MRMLRIYLLILFVFSLTHYSFAQTNYEYLGGLKLNDSTIISYKINFIVNDEDVKGFSVTDLGGEHETRSNVFGEYDIKKRELSFRETGIVYTKSPVSQNDFCFLNVTAKNFVFGKTKSVKTKFIGLFSDNTECINGEIALNSAEKVEKRINKVVTKINKSKRVADSVKQKINMIKVMDSLNMNILRKNQTLSFFTKSSKIRFIIYDGGQEDGDNITITSNGKTILKSYVANKTEKYLDVDLNSNKTSIVIKANNEGKIAPNTVVVKIDDGSNLVKALSNLKTSETTQIDILKN